MLGAEQANRSTIVAPIDITRFPAYVDALDIAQRMSTRLAATLRTEADIAVIEEQQRAFIQAVAARGHLVRSASNKDFHMAISRAGRNPYITSFYDKLLDESRRILHLHFDYIERTPDGKLLIGEHEEMITAIREKTSRGPMHWQATTPANSATTSSTSCVRTMLPV